MGVPWIPEALCAIGMIGYLGSDRPLAQQPFALAHRELYERARGESMPFDEGDEVYFLLPRYEDAVVTLEELEMNPESGEPELATVVFTAQGNQPLMLACNISDIFPNCRITVESQGQSVTFSPYISLMDGRPVYPDGGQVQDIAPRDYCPPEDSLSGAWGCETMYDGFELVLNLDFQEYARLHFGYGPPYSEYYEQFYGAYYWAEDGQAAICMDSIYPGVDYEDEPDYESYEFYGVFELRLEEDDSLTVTYVSGLSLLYGQTEGDSLRFIRN